MSPYDRGRLALALPVIALMISPAIAGDKKSKKTAAEAPITAPEDSMPPAAMDGAAPTAAQTPSSATPTPTDVPPSTPQTPQSGLGTIAQGVANSADHSTLAAAVKAAGLDQALAGAGPYTMFAPTNAGFDKLPKGTLDTLLKAENKQVLAAILSNHVVSGNVSAAALTAKIKAGGGTTTINTLAGQTLTAKMEGDAVTLADGNGNVARVTKADLPESNGVIHVIDGLLLPKPAK
jgi:uncharacterized surface protein with fasciclin (FAS1) repeats